MKKLPWVVVQLFCVFLIAEVSFADAGPPSAVPATSAPSIAVSLAPTVPAEEIPGLAGQLDQAVSVVNTAFQQGWTLPLVLILLSSITYIGVGLLKAKKIVTEPKSILMFTVAAGLLFGVGSMILLGSSVASAVIMTLAGPGALPLHKLMKLYLGIDIGSHADKQ